MIFRRICLVLSLIILSSHSQRNDQEQEETLKTLKDETFEHLTQAATGATTGDWLVVFTTAANTCSTCTQAIQVFEELSHRLYRKMNVAKVDVDVNKILLRRFKVSRFPTIILFRQGFQFDYYGDVHADKLQNFVEGGYRDARKQAVMQQPSTFDMLLEDTLDEVKFALKDRKLASGAMISIGAISGILFLSILLCCCIGGSKEDTRIKKEN